MTDEDDPDGSDPGFAVGEAGKALHQTWHALNEARLWIGFLVEDDKTGNATIVDENITDGLEAIKRAEKALGIRFIPPGRPKTADKREKPGEPEDVPF